MITKFNRLNHNEIITEFNKCYDISKISKILGISIDLIQKVLLTNGINYKTTKIDRINHKDVVKIYLENYSLDETSKVFNVSSPTIKKILKLHNIEIKDRAVYNKIDDLEVINTYKKTGNVKTTSIEFGVSISVIRKKLISNGIKIKWVKLSDEEVLNSFKEHKQIEKVSKELKCGYTYVSNILKKYNIIPPRKSGIEIGDIFGKLTVIDITQNITEGKSIFLKYRCKCECGNEVNWRSVELNVDKRTDCGCVYNEKLKLSKERKEIKRLKSEQWFKTVENNRKLKEETRKLIEERKNENRLKVGQKFHRWTITEIIDIKNVLAKCECGTIKKVSNTNIKHYSKSCGCLQIEMSTKHGNSPKKDINKRKWYDRWRSMVKRCYNEKFFAYENYGGRGIKICDRWLEPNGVGCKNYYNDIHEILGEQPGENYSLDRIDNDGMYTIENLRWATTVEQRNNQRKKTKFL